MKETTNAAANATENCDKFTFTIPATETNAAITVNGEHTISTSKHHKFTFTIPATETNAAAVITVGRQLDAVAIREKLSAGDIAAALAYANSPVVMGATFHRDRENARAAEKRVDARAAAVANYAAARAAYESKYEQLFLIRLDLDAARAAMVSAADAIIAAEIAETRAAEKRAAAAAAADFEKEISAAAAAVKKDKIANAARKAADKERKAAVNAAAENGDFAAVMKAMGMSDAAIAAAMAAQNAAAVAGK